jgi:hypothetical protein
VNSRLPCPPTPASLPVPFWKSKVPCADNEVVEVPISQMRPCPGRVIVSLVFAAVSTPGPIPRIAEPSCAVGRDLGQIDRHSLGKVVFRSAPTRCGNSVRNCTGPVNVKHSQVSPSGHAGAPAPLQALRQSKPDVDTACVELFNRCRVCAGGCHNRHGQNQDICDNTNQIWF